MLAKAMALTALVLPPVQFATASAADPAGAENTAQLTAWLRIDSPRNELLRTSAVPDEAIDYGRFQWVPSAPIDIDALRNAGIAFMQVDHPFVLDLGGERFDPLISLPVSGSSTHQPSGASDWHLVQFRGPIKSEWLDALRASGTIPAQYIHPFTYAVWSDNAALDRARAHAEVRWAGDFQTAFRVSANQRSFDATMRPTMALISRHRNWLDLQGDLLSLGITILSNTPIDEHFSVLDLVAPGNRYPDLASLPGVYTVQAIAGGGGPRGEMSGQSIVGAYGSAPNYTIVPGYPTWLVALGYNGAGVIVSVVDGGFRSTHLDLATHLSPCVASGATPTSCTTSNNSHGTHVAGAIAGTAASGTLLNGFLRGQGIAPGALLVQQRYNEFLGAGPGSMFANGMLKIYKESALSGAVLTNNSWGPTGTPQGYDIPTQQIDMVIRDANPDMPGNQQLQNVWSIMNGNGDGSGACAPSSLGSPDEAKNLFAVGSTSLQTNGSSQLTEIFNVSSNSAHGNACDGRRVPNIVAPGCYTDSASSGSNTAFALLCGTSMASPVVTGASALFVQKYRSEHAGETPSPALIKAVFTAVAKDLEGFRDADNRLLGHRPDRFQGYGRLDLDAAVHSPDAIFSLDQSEVFTATGASWTQTFTAADPAKPVRIMLAWTDAKGHGLGGTTAAWVNDLDLSVNNNRASYLGNVIGSDGWSASGGTADAKNNLEGVFLSPAQLDGPFSINVLAANIAADALHPYTPAEPSQDFALICYNCTKYLLGSADLEVSAYSNPVLAEADAALDLIFDVANLGADVASGAHLIIELPAELTLASSSVTAGTASWACASVGQTVTCDQTSGSLPVNANAASITLTTHVAPIIAPGAAVEVSASIHAPQFTDAHPENNAATIAIPIGDAIFSDGFE